MDNINKNDNNENDTIMTKINSYNDINNKTETGKATTTMTGKCSLFEVMLETTRRCRMYLQIR